MVVVIALLALLVSLLFIHIRFVLRKRRLFGRSWDDVLNPVEAIDLSALQNIADTFGRSQGDHPRMEPAEMWNAVGGFAGIQRLRSNAEAMLSLAIYAERWNCEKTMAVSDGIRRDALQLTRCLNRVEISTFYGLGKLRAPLALQEAITTYCSMRDRLLGPGNDTSFVQIPLLEGAL